jgi:heme exporter protein A
LTLLSGQGLALVRGGRLLFEGLDFSLDAGEGLHLVGPNGAGKSSLLRMIAGLLPPTAGRIERAGIALADDQLALDRERPRRSALAGWGGPGLDRAMEAFGLEALADVPVRMLSTGQARRARLARVVASNAPLWLLDEPFNGLDSANGEALDRVIAHHREGGGCVVIASHSAPRGDWRRLELGR